MLLMKKVFFDGIRWGTKTTTLRYWRRCHIRPETVHTVPGLGKVRIDEVEPVAPEQLDDSDACADGFDDLAALMAALDELYPPESREARKLYRIRFTFLGESHPS